MPLSPFLHARTGRRVYKSVVRQLRQAVFPYDVRVLDVARLFVFRIIYYPIQLSFQQTGRFLAPFFASQYLSLLSHVLIENSSFVCQL